MEPVSKVMAAQLIDLNEENKQLRERIRADENRQMQFTAEQVDLIKRQIAKGATDDELQLFIGQCRRTGLDPFARQVYAVKRWDAREQRSVMAIQVSIDGQRLIAERTGHYEGQDGPYWCGEDGEWRNVWLSSAPPAAAKVGVCRTGFQKPLYAVARWESYVQLDKAGEPTGLWARMPDLMLAKCAEALALRRTFPQELSGIYTAEEMAQAAPTSDASEASEMPEMQSAPPKKTSDLQKMIIAFSKLRGRLRPENDHFYAEILNNFGVRHSNMFRNLETAREAYRALQAKVVELEIPPQTEQLAAENDLESDGEVST